MSRLSRWKSPTQHPTSSSSFHYPPLISAKTGVRLARLLPGYGSKGITIELIDAFMTGSGRTEYDALSYVWGTSERDKTITCNGKQLQVTKTLIEALSRFRQADAVVTLWIDQICICQDRVKERNAQVQMMGRIYKSARKVIVWLGDDYDDSKAGIQLARQLLGIAHGGVIRLAAGDLEPHGLPKQGSRRWKALSQILRRPWFWRTWIVQEVVLNPTVELVLGSASLSWDDLEVVVALLEGKEESHDQLTALPFSRINNIRLHHQRRSSSRPASSRIWSGDSVLFDEPANYNDLEHLDLLDLLLMSRSLGVTDARDKIYALLGLGKHSIDPDYSMSAESVFTDFALTTIGEVTNLVAQRTSHGEHATRADKKVRKVMILLSCAGKQNQKLDLPTWAPDWTTNLMSQPFVFGPFAAGGDRLGMFDWQPDLGLQLSGVLFDIVQTAGSVLLQDASLLSSWWAEINTIAAKRAVCSPGSTANVDALHNLRKALGLCKHGYFIGEGSKREDSLLGEPELITNEHHSNVHTMTLGPGPGRVLIVSATGYIGLAPHGTQEGDVIFVVQGFDVPLVLRQKGEAFELIGEAYVQGIMHGEALAMSSVLGIQEIMVR